MSSYNLSSLRESRPLTLEEVEAFVETPKSTFEHLIEFDDSMCIAELHLVHGFYGSLLESNNYVLHEGVVESIINFIKEIINKIFSAIKSIFGTSNRSDSDKKTVGDKQKSTEEMFEKLKNKKPKFDEKSKDFKKKHKVIKYQYPPKIIDIDTFINQNDKVKELNQKMQSAQNNISSIKPVNKSSADTSYKQIEEYNKILEEASKIAKSEGFNSKDAQFGMDNTSEEDVAAFCAEKYKDLVFGEKTKICTEDLSKSVTQSNSLKEFEKRLNDTSKQLKESINKLSSEVGEEYVNKYILAVEKMVKLTAAYIKICFEQYSAYADKVVSYYNLDIKQLNMFVDSVIGEENNEGTPEPDNSNDEEEEVTSESFISPTFGEIMLAHESAFNHTYYEILREGMIKEALIMGNPDPSIDKVYEMQSLNEAIANKARNAFNTIIAAIKKAYATFMEKLRANFTTTKNYLDKYNKVILENKIPEGPYQSKNFIDGMYRIIDFEIPALQYNQIKDNLKSPYTFFNFIADKLKNRPNNLPQVVDGDKNETLKQIGEYFKVYFGCAGEDVTYNTDYVQNSVKDMYDFCYDIRKIERSINNSIKEMENLRNNALKQAGVQQVQQPTPDGDSTKTTTGTNAPQNPTVTPTTPPVNNISTQNASYFSYIDNLDTLLELKNVNNSGSATTPSNNNAPTSMTGRVADNMRNFTNDGAKDTNGNNVYGVQGSPVSQVDADCQVYASVCKKILEAKLTAVEFCRSEIMQLFRMVVATYVQGETVANPRAQNTQNMQPRNRQQ